MSYKANIKNLEKVRHQASNSNFLDVAFDIVEENEGEEKVVASRRIGLDANSSQGEVVEEVRKHVSTYAKEQEQAEVQAELDAQDDNVNELRESLVGKSVGEQSPEAND